MNHRRGFLKALSSSALAAPLFQGVATAQRSDASGIPAMPAAGDPRYWDKIRDQFMLARDKVFFNNGTIGAMPRVVVERVSDHLRKMATDIADWDYHSGAEWISGYGPFTDIRTKIGKLINADVKEIALTENNTASMSYVAAGLNLDQGAEIIMSDQEHPGGRSPWVLKQKRRGTPVIEVKLAKPAHDPEQMLQAVRAAITPKTKVIAISHVISGSGAILPVKQICAEARSRGIFTVLDGAQAVGHIPVDVKDLGCDAYVGCLHKWLLAPAGNGFLYVRQGSWQDVWTTIASSNWDNFADTGYRLTQRGTGSLSLIEGMDAALDFHFSIGPERWQQRVKYLGDYLRDGLRKVPKVKIYSPEDPAMSAAITVYGIEGYNGAQLQDEMWNRGRLRPRSSSGIALRHCTHIFNSTAEIDRALNIVHQLARA